ncbi:MAG: hypothetical protein J7604_26000, partial [Sporocytophaga sp.]|uniref:hypothetical protein n=1 Tax=Sporocytophaga sp. TaxID=2231183 RepID=UPI001B018623
MSINTKTHFFCLLLILFPLSLLAQWNLKNGVPYTDGPTMTDMIFLNDKTTGFTIAEKTIYKTTNQGETWKP